jgi:hypothetical protein
VFRHLQQRLRVEHQTVRPQANHDAVNAIVEHLWKNSIRYCSTRIGLSQPRVLEVILEDQQVPFCYSRIAHLPQTMALYTYCTNNCETPTVWSLHVLCSVRRGESRTFEISERMLNTLNCILTRNHTLENLCVIFFLSYKVHFLFSAS